ncbi:MAG: gliding motility-associated C-terminal domain-containing protein [Bacteroidales bacterium]|nr:gliding motility-associated C-terminal domain-containing protein [Bacteroidales bacterium]
MKKLSIFLSCIFITCVSVFAQYSTLGTDFWLSFMQNFDNPANTLIYITSASGTTGTASMPGTGWSQNFTVPVNGSVLVTVPAAQVAAIETGNAVLNKGIHITANSEIAVYAANQRTASSDATLVMPVHALGDSYIINTYSTFSSEPSMFIIVGVAANTSIEIIPSASITGGVSANVPFTITLNQGQVYLVKSSGDLTGSKVNATDVGNCNNFAIFAGNKCANVPLSCTYCDHLYEQMIPLKAWGKEYITVPLMTRSSATYRIIASENGTVVNINGGANINLNASSFHEVALSTASFIVGNKPISVAQYSQGTSCDNVVSDPFMIMLSPVEQTLESVIFQAFNTTAINQFYTNIVCKTPYTGTVTLDGSSVTGWATVPSNTAYSYVRKNVSQGTHKLICPEGLLTTVYGFGDVESYGYLAGANIQPLNVDYNIVIGNDSISYEFYQDTLNCEESSNGVGFCTDGIGISGVWFDFGDGVTATGTNVFHVYANSGTYTVTMYFTRDASCVEESLTMLVHVSNSLPPFDFINDTLICNGGPFVINPNVTGVDFLWQDNSTSSTHTVSSSGTYALTISDNQGCSASATADVTFINISASITSTPITCSGVTDGELTANQTGGTIPVSYVWNTTPAQTSQTISGLGVGNYTVTVTDDNNCSATASHTLIMPPSLNVSHSEVNDESCYHENDGSAIINVNGGTTPYTIEWNPNNVSGFAPVGLSPGTYSYTVTDDYGCYGIDSFNIKLANNIHINVTPVDAGCFGEPVSASVTAYGGTGNLSIVWDDGSTLYNNTNIPANTDFGFTITDENGCTKTDVVNLNSPTELIINSELNHITCKGDKDGVINITITGGVTPYITLWNAGLSGNSLSNLDAGNYSVTVTDDHNCTVTKSFLLTEATQELKLDYVSRNVTCYSFRDGSMLLAASGGISPYTYTAFDTYQFYQGSNQTGIPAGIYTARVTDSHNCIFDTSVVIHEPSELIAELIISDPSCIGNNDGSIEIIVTGGIEPYYYKYANNLVDFPYISRLLEGEYAVEIFDSMRCEVDLGIAILEDVQISCIVIPDAFTPNGDGINDTFIIEGMEIFPTALLRVFNRWGQLLHIAETGEDWWDGKYQDKFVPTGTYLYILDLRNGKKPFKGTVTVVY